MDSRSHTAISQRDSLSGWYDLRVPIVEVNGQRIHYTDQGSGPAVVLAHSMLLDLVTLKPLADGLVRDGYRVVSFDARGHGQTRYDGKPFQFTDHSLDVLALMDSLGIETAIVGGEEQGAGIALFTALAAPERVSGLLLINISGHKASAAEQMAVNSSMDIWTTQGPTEKTFGLVANAATSTPEQARALMERWRASRWFEMREPANALLSRPDIVDQLPGITCPAVVVHGSSEFFIPVDEGKELAESLGGPTAFALIDTAGQNLSIVSNPKVVDALREMAAAQFSRP